MALRRSRLRLFFFVSLSRDCFYGPREAGAGWELPWWTGVLTSAQPQSDGSDLGLEQADPPGWTGRSPCVQERSERQVTAPLPGTETTLISLSSKGDTVGRQQSPEGTEATHLGPGEGQTWPEPGGDWLPHLRDRGWASSPQTPRNMFARGGGRGSGQVGFASTLYARHVSWARSLVPLSLSSQ